jgi:glyoxylase-like metal-dependent hydrolase (beta-lactamase superfamily II)
MAAGHMAGSQFVYVKLDGGTEILLVGDVVWMSSALGHKQPVTIISGERLVSARSGHLA